MERKTVLIVDDHVAMRQGLKFMISDLYPKSVISEAFDGESMVVILKKQRVDILIMDIQMPHTDSISLVEFVSITYPDTYILIFSMLPEHIYGPRLIKAGADGYLPKESDLEEMNIAFNEVFSFRKYVSSNLYKIIKQLKRKERLLNPFSKLSYREFELVNSLLLGYNVNIIARNLNLKPSTVSTYKARMFEKLQISTLFELKELAELNEWRHHMKMEM